MKNNNPTSVKVSVITVVYNDSKGLERTIKSVVNQSFHNFEYIIIDGGSEDGTLDIIKEHRDDIDYWVSEPDEGIYDAMNKGLLQSSGEWGIFMNAGDSFAGIKVLEKVFTNNNYTSGINFIVGKTRRSYFNGFYISEPDFFCDPRIGMGFSHQSVFFRVDYHKENLFNLDYKLMADFEFFCRAKGFRYFPITISNFITGGASRLSWKLNIKERYKIFKKYVDAPTLYDRLVFFETIIKYLIVTLFIGEGNLKRLKNIVSS